MVIFEASLSAILKSLLTRPYDRSEDIVKKSVKIADMLIEATDE